MFSWKNLTDLVKDIATPLTQPTSISTPTNSNTPTHSITGDDDDDSIANNGTTSTSPLAPDTTNNNNNTNTTNLLTPLKNINVNTESFKKIGSKFTLFANNVITKIDQERKKFMEDGAGKDDDGMLPPWLDFTLEDKELETIVIDKILDLKMSKRTFTVPPPIDSDYCQEFDGKLIAIAKASLKYDKNLERVRFLLVPRFISEEQFWKNWYYRVLETRKEFNIVSNVKTIEERKSSQTKQSDSQKQTSTTTTTTATTSPNATTTTTNNNNDEISRWERELQSELENFQFNDDQDPANIDLSMNNELVLDDDDVGDIDTNNLDTNSNSDWSNQVDKLLSSPKFISPYSPSLQQQNDDEDKQNNELNNNNNNNNYESDVDIDKEIEQELEKMERENRNSPVKIDEPLDQEDEEILKRLEDEFNSSSATYSSPPQTSHKESLSDETSEGEIIPSTYPE